MLNATPASALRSFSDALRSFAAGKRIASLAAFAAVMLAAVTLTSCATPGAIGVQDFGTVQGRVIDARSNQPISGALINVGSLATTRSDPSGVFQLRVPTGDQMVIVNANGYVGAAPIAVTVVKDMTVNVGSAAIALQPVNP